MELPNTHSLGQRVPPPNVHIATALLDVIYVPRKIIYHKDNNALIPPPWKLIVYTIIGNHFIRSTHLLNLEDPNEQSRLATVSEGRAPMT